MSEIEKLEEYWPNGQKKSEGTYKDDKRDGLWTEWHENGQKYKELTYKDGKWDGLYTRWLENGQKWFEGTYKDGEEISAWWLDEDGDEW